MRRVIICAHCSHQLQPLAMKCGHCGRSYRNRHVAAAIAVVGGLVGAHRFYLQSWLIGAAYLAASTAAVVLAPKALAVVAAAALVEAGVFLAMPETSWRRTYGRAPAAARG